MIGGSEFDKSDFLSFAKKIKELTNKTYLAYLVDVLLNEGKEEELAECKEEMKVLLASYNKKSKFDDLNEIVVLVAKSNDYQDVADDHELYNFVGMTEEVLKKIGINYVLTEVQMGNIRNIMESPNSSSSSSSSSSSISSDSSYLSSRGRKKKKKSKKKHKSKKHKRRSNKSKKRKRRSKKSKKR